MAPLGCGQQQDGNEQELDVFQLDLNPGRNINPF
jgi:hypothetical protein